MIQNILNIFVLIQDNFELIKTLIYKTLKGTFFDYSNAFKIRSLFLIVEKKFQQRNTNSNDLKRF